METDLAEWFPRIGQTAAGETADLGEYDPQYGFGWTNGVVTALSARQ